MGDTFTPLVSTTFLDNHKAGPYDDRRRAKVIASAKPLHNRHAKGDKAMRRWVDEEILTLIRNRNLPMEQLCRLLPNRDRGGIAAALGGMDQYFHGRPIRGLLSKRFIAILQEECPLQPAGVR